VDVGELIPGIAGVGLPIMKPGEKPGAALSFTLLCAKLTPGVLEHYGALLKEEIDAIVGQ
jgi:DNA-binding IclR family transcriptional regulator